MSPFDQLGIQSFDFVEFAVQDINASSEPFLKLGFEKSASRQIAKRKLKSHLLTQNGIAVILSQSNSPEDPIYRFVADHGEGIFNIAFLVTDAIKALEVASARGAYLLDAPRKYVRDYGSIEYTTIHAFADVRHTFIARSGSLFHEGFELPFRSMNRGYGLEQIVSFEAAIEKNDEPSWSGFYQGVLGLTLSSENSSYLRLESPHRTVRVVADIAIQNDSSAHKFTENNHGGGIRFLGLESREIKSTLALLQKEKIEVAVDSVSTAPLIGQSCLKLIQSGT